MALLALGGLTMLPTSAPPPPRALDRPLSFTLAKPAVPEPEPEAGAAAPVARAAPRPAAAPVRRPDPGPASGQAAPPEMAGPAPVRPAAPLPPPMVAPVTPASPAPPPPAPASDAAAARDAYAARLWRHIAAHRSRGSRLAGVVLVGFSVDRGGGVSAVEVIRGSGDPMLDRLAVRTILRSSPVPPPPDALDEAMPRFTIPFSFR